MLITYIFAPLVHAPWGEMQINFTTRAESFYAARRNVQHELAQWKRSQEQLQRNDFPWLDEAIKTMENYEGGTVLGMSADKDTKVFVNWYDEREGHQTTIRCEACHGTGDESAYLADFRGRLVIHTVSGGYVQCSVCKGKGKIQV